jgi:hypothetical protein
VTATAQASRVPSPTTMPSAGRGPGTYQWHARGQMWIMETLRKRPWPFLISP